VTGTAKSRPLEASAKVQAIKWAACVHTPARTKQLTTWQPAPLLWAVREITSREATQSFSCSLLVDPSITWY